MGRKRLFRPRKQKPTLKVDPSSYERLKAEADLLNRGYGKIKIGELLGFIIDVYFDNKDAFRDLTGGAIGTQPEWEVEQRDKKSKKIKQKPQKSLFNRFV